MKIKQDGKMRETLRRLNLEDVEVLPQWLSEVSAPKDKFDFKNMTEGSGRNQELFNYILYLQSKGFSREEIKQIIQIINDFVFADPLPYSEIATITRDEAFKPESEFKIYKAAGGNGEPKAKETVVSDHGSYDNSNFNHIAIGEKIISEHRLIRYDGVTYEYIDHYYRPAEFLRKYVRETHRGAKKNQVAEVVSYIEDMKQLRSGSVNVNPYIINLTNTRLDIRTGECLDFDPDIIEFTRIPVTYNPNAHSAELDGMLWRVFCGDTELIDLFDEMLGYMLLKDNRFNKVFLFTGGGSNGKSTILDLIKAFLGKENYVALSLQEVTNRFNRIHLVNKHANIGDDIENTLIKDTGMIKKMTSGDGIFVENKGEKGYSTELFAKHLYSANETPRSTDKTDGFYRRWIFIPFNAKFSPSDPGFDPKIVDKISTPMALSHLLNRAIKGIQRVLGQNAFTVPQCVHDILEAYKIDNSTTLSWIDDKDLTEDYFLTTPTDKLYSEFEDWCKVSGIRTQNITGKKAFFKEIIRKFDFEEKTIQRRPERKRYFVLKI